MPLRVRGSAPQPSKPTGAGLEVAIARGGLVTYLEKTSLIASSYESQLYSSLPATIRNDRIHFLVIVSFPLLESLFH